MCLKRSALHSFFITFYKHKFIFYQYYFNYQFKLITNYHFFLRFSERLKEIFCKLVVLNS